MIGGWVFSGNVPITLTFGSAAAFVVMGLVLLAVVGYLRGRDTGALVR